MEYFEQCEIAVLIVLSLSYLFMFPIYALAIHLRRFGPLRDVQPMLCVLTHLGGMIYNYHLFFAWKHDTQICILLAVVQFVSSTTYFCTFLAKHYVLHRRYAAVASTMIPTTIVWLLCAFPFVVLATYRIATRSDGACPNVDGLVALFGGLIVLGTVFRFVLREHPSSHYRRAIVTEICSVFLGAGTSAVRQYTSNDVAMVVSNVALCIAVNAAFLAYVVPPIMLRLRRGNEFDDEQERILNDSIAAGSLGSEASRQSLISRVLVRLSEAVRPSTSERSHDAESSNGSPRGQSSLGGFTAPNLGSGGGGGGGGGGYGSNGNSGGLDASPFGGGRADREISRELATVLELIQEGSLERLERFVMRCGLGVINATDTMGRTPLHHAVRHGDLGIVRFLVEIGADPNHFDERGHSPLHETVRRRDHKDRSSAITELVQGGALVNMPSQQGLVPLHFAVLHGHLGALNTLLRYDASPTYGHDKEEKAQPWDHVHITHCQSVGDAGRKSPLMLAVEMNEEMMVSSMMHALRLRSSESGRGLAGISGALRFSPDFRCPHGLSLLHVALALGNSKVVAALLHDCGCSPRAMHEESGMNVFHFAAIGDNGECVSLLLSHLDVPDIMPVPSAGGSALDAGWSPFASVSIVPTPNTGNTSGGGSGSRRPSFPVDAIPSQRAGAIGGGGGGPLDGASTRGLHMRGVTQYGMGWRGGASMGFGQAYAKLKEHVPNVTPDAGRLTELEAAVDRAVQKLRAKSAHREVEALHRALVIVSKRIRMNSSRSLSNLYNSQPPSYQVTVSQGATDVKPMERVREMLNQVDGSRYTPLHYAIQQGNAEMVAVFVAYGAAFVETDEAMACGSRESSNARLTVDKDILADDCDLSEATLRREQLAALQQQATAAASSSPPLAPAPSGSKSSSQGGAIAKVNCASHARFILKHTDSDSQRRLILAAVREGQNIAAGYLASSRARSDSESPSSGTTPNSSSQFRPSAA